MSVLIAYPWLAAGVGAFFVFPGWRRRRWGVVTVGVMWVLYAAYETGMQQRWLCTGECNIRVDLLLIYPILPLAAASCPRGGALESPPPRLPAPAQSGSRMSAQDVEQVILKPIKGGLSWKPQ